MQEEFDKNMLLKYRITFNDFYDIIWISYSCYRLSSLKRLQNPVPASKIFKNVFNTFMDNEEADFCSAAYKFHTTNVVAT